MARADTVRVEVTYCAGPGLSDVVALELPAGATVATAVLASGFVQRHGLQAQALRTGVWGQLRDSASVLRERDRVEIYRPLVVDPKEARRQRDRQHREKRPTSAPAPGG